MSVKRQHHALVQVIFISLKRLIFYIIRFLFLSLLSCLTHGNLLLPHIIHSKFPNIVLRYNMHVAKCTNLRCTTWWNTYFVQSSHRSIYRKFPAAWKVFSCPLPLSILNKTPIILRAITTDFLASSSNSFKWYNK